VSELVRVILASKDTIWSYLFCLCCYGGEGGCVSETNSDDTLASFLAPVASNGRLVTQTRIV